MAVAQQSSRGGLITALVVFVVLFFVAAIFAVVKSIDAADSEKRRADLDKTYNAVASRADLASDELRMLTESRGNRTVFDTILEQRNTLSSRITGRPVDAQQAIQAVDQVIADANAKLKPTVVSSDSLIGAVKTLTDQVLQRQQQSAELQAKLAQATEELNNQVAIYRREIEEARKHMEGARAEASRANELVNAYRTGKDQDINRLEKNLSETIESNRKTIEELNAQVAQKQQQITELTKKFTAAVAAIPRPQNSADPMIRRADGHILNVQRNARRPQESVVYINLGLGMGVSPGMTFQMYDKVEGIPRTGATEADATELPPGKGSIEVTKVGSGSSECRIIRLAAGADIMVGDLIANLIYDPNTKFQFRVYGEFDLDQDGRASADEADIVRRLVVQWGGRLTDTVNVDTDYVVLGAEPRLPDFTPDEIQQDPEKQFLMDQATKAREAYNQVRDEAIGLHIPVLNQNRFLYMTGFYDQARR